jgi:hypothetical protein
MMSLFFSPVLILLDVDGHPVAVADSAVQASHE